MVETLYYAENDVLVYLWIDETASQIALSEF
jgi:hypothetical protein